MFHIQFIFIVGNPTSPLLWRGVGHLENWLNWGGSRFSLKKGGISERRVPQGKVRKKIQIKIFYSNFDCDFLQQEWKFEVELTKINCLWGLLFLFGAFVKCTYCMIVCSDIWASIVWSMFVSKTSICSKAWFIGPWFFWFKTDNNYMLHKTEIIWNF